MTRRCPACGLPISAHVGGAVTTPTDGPHHAVVAICRRCIGNAARIPPGTYRKMLDRATIKALADPDAYLVTTLQDAGAARLALGLLGHPAHVLQAINALGWGNDMGEAK